MVIARADIAEARQRLDSRLRATPVLDVPVAELVGGGEGTLSLKLEFLQHSGTFKARGAMHRMLVAETGLSDGPRRVVAASGGNHGAAVAWAARELGWDATIFVPTIASPAKVERLVSYGARVEQVGAMFSEAHDASQQHVAQQVVAPLTIHPYDDPIAVAGAGTCAAEWSEQSAPLDTVWVACGGGGLAAGTSAWFGSGVDMRVCETLTTPTFATARAAGHPVDVSVSGVAADALGATRLGAVAWGQLSEVGARSEVVDDDAVMAARSAVWERFRIWLEPSAATAVAAFIASPPGAGHHGIILCGANAAVG
jgi:threonine dehydratase